MKKYKFITIKPTSDDICPADPTQETYFIFNNKSREVIGRIEYYRQWKQWVFLSENEESLHGDSGDSICVVWSADCLEDVIDFIKNEIPKEKS